MELLIFPQKGYRLDRKNCLRKITFFINQKERERERKFQSTNLRKIFVANNSYNYNPKIKKE